MTLKEAVPVAEQLDFEFDFGWHSGSPLRSQACFQYRLQPLRATAAFKQVFQQTSKRADYSFGSFAWGAGARSSNPRAPTNPPLNPRYLPAPIGFRTAVFRSSLAIIR